MNDVSFSLLKLDDSLIYMLENIRYNAYNINLSSDISSLYIEQLFIDKKYQNSGLHFGSVYLNMF